MSEPFVGDESRQATAAIGGYVYQLWWSLYAWCMLPPREDLYLERAEDFAVVGPATAEVVQVKDTSRTLTLSSSEALSAIANWWNHRTRNPGRRIHLRFLTTAKAGIERDRVFGDEGGVVYWERAKRLGADLTALRAFLQEQEELPTELREFVTRASDEELRQDLVKGLSWDFDKPTREDVRARVERELVEVCVPRYGSYAEEARGLAPRLLDIVMEAILHPGDRQPLTNARLQDTLDDLLTGRRPLKQLRALELGATFPGGMPGLITQGGAAPTIRVAFHEGPQGADTALPSGFLERDERVTAIAATLRSRGMLVLRGSTGMGKSRLALLTMRRLGGNWLLLDLRGRGPEEVRWQLRGSSASPRVPGIAGVLIDDLDFDDEPEKFENDLIRFLNDCRLASWNVLLTTHSQLSSRIVAEADLPAEVVVVTPPFDEEEVRHLAELHGCPPGLQAERWAKVIHSTTQGHPQLAHARVYRLKGEGWPASDDRVVKLLTSTEDLASVQQEARQRLEADLPSPTARSLAYRLAVFTTYFTREQALLMGKIANPGEVFDRLCGPWIEGPTDGYYRLSPLLKGSAPAVLGEPEVTRARRDICRAIISTRSLSPIDFAELVFQAYGAGYEHGLVVAALLCFRMPREHERRLLGNLLWLPLLKLGPGESLYPRSPTTGLLLRHLQFRVALAVGASVTEVMDAWDREFASVGGKMGDRATLHRSMFLCDVLFRAECPLDVERSIVYGSEVLTIAATNPKLLPPATGAGGDHREFDFAASVVDAVVLRLRGPRRVTAFLQALESMPESRTQAFVLEFRRDPGNAVNLMMALFEADKLAECDARALEEPIELAARIGQHLNIPDLLAAAIRTQAVVDSEYLNDPQSALVRLDAGSKQLGGEPPILADYRATILVALGKDEDALRIWRDLLPRWHGAESTRMFSARQAGMAASRLREHSEAGRLFAQAETLARHEGFGVLAVGLAAERALAFWRGGERERAIASLTGVLKELETLPDPETNLEVRNLHKLVGHSVLWMLRETRGTDFSGVSWIVEPPPGRLSQSRVDERIRALPLGPIAWAWAMLAALEIETDSGDSLQEEWARRRTGASTAFQWQIDMSLVRKALRSPGLEQLFERAAAVFDDLLRIRASGEQHGSQIVPEPEKGEFIADALAAGVVIRSAEGAAFEALPIEHWKEEAARLRPVSPLLDGWLEAMQRIVSGADPAPLARGSENRAAVRVAAAVLVVKASPNPNELYVGSATLVSGYRQSLWRTAVGGSVTKLIVSSWEAVLRDQRFALQSPRLVVPAIQEALAESSASDLVKCARILLAARPGVIVSMSTEFVSALEDLAKGGTSTGAESETKVEC